ncbi:unnamed protein product, partial [Rotaria sp. Silwood1]
MINTLESLSNEIILLIFSEIRWFEMIESFWTLNKRFHSLICSKLSIDYNGIIISKRCLSFNKCHSIMTSEIFNWSYLFSSIKSIDINGTNSNCCDIISEWIFHEKVLRF